MWLWLQSLEVQKIFSSLFGVGTRGKEMWKKGAYRRHWLDAQEYLMLDANIIQVLFN